MTIAIVTDSTCDLPAEQLATFGGICVPLYVLFDSGMYQDGRQLTAEELVAGIQQGKAIPSTSQPSPAEFRDAYRQALERADQVISLHISSRMSGTVGSARLAAQEFGSQVTVIDSQSVTVGLGLQVLRAAEMIQAGAGTPEIVQALERVRQRADLRFTVDTLDFLRLNGRIGGATALLGGLLNIKPILVVRDGQVGAGGKVRGRKKALADLVERVREYAAEHGGARVGFLATPGGQAERAEVREQLSDLKFRDMGDFMVGAVVSAHVGPGAIGVALEPLDA